MEIFFLKTIFIILLWVKLTSNCNWLTHASSHIPQKHLFALWQSTCDVVTQTLNPKCLIQVMPVECWRSTQARCSGKLIVKYSSPADIDVVLFSIFSNTHILFHLVFLHCTSTLGCSAFGSSGFGCSAFGSSALGFSACDSLGFASGCCGSSVMLHSFLGKEKEYC